MSTGDSVSWQLAAAAIGETEQMSASATRLARLKAHVTEVAVRNTTGRTFPMLGLVNALALVLDTPSISRNEKTGYARGYREIIGVLKNVSAQAAVSAATLMLICGCAPATDADLLFWGVYSKPTPS